MQQFSPDTAIPLERMHKNVPDAGTLGSSPDVRPDPSKSGNAASRNSIKRRDACCWKTRNLDG